MKPAESRRQTVCRRCYHDDGYQCARQTFRYLGSEHDDEQRYYGCDQCRHVYARQRLEVQAPFGYELARYVAQAEAEEIIYLCREYRKCDTRRKAYDNRVGYELYHRAEAEKTQEYKYHAGHEGRHSKAVQAELADDIVYYYDESTCRTTDLHRVAAEKRHHETADDCCHKADCGAHARGDTECDCKRQCYDTYNDTGYDICLQTRSRVIS